MGEEEEVVNFARVDDCKYWKPHDGEYWQGHWEFYDVCFGFGNECFCEDKIFCPHKIKFWTKHPVLSLKYLRQDILMKIKELSERKKK